MQITREQWEALAHCNRCGFLARFEALPHNRPHSRQHDGIWLHWDCNTNCWWASDLDIEQLVKAGMLVRPDPNTVDITEAGKNALANFTPQYKEPEDPLIKKMDEYFQQKGSVPQFFAGAVPASTDPGASKRDLHPDIKSGEE